MTRIFTQDKESNKPEIDQEKVKSFFSERAKKLGAVSYKQVVIYQDKNSNLAEERDEHEKMLLLPMLNLNPRDRLLDIGCGTGRWAEVIVDKVSHYHGTDLIEDLVSIAKARNSQDNTLFSCLPCTQLTLNNLEETEPFNKIIMLGVLIYLNDSDLNDALQSIVKTASEKCTFLLREPVGIEQRLTIKEHFSEDMEQVYNAIYRTSSELLDACEKVLIKEGFELIDTGDVFTQAYHNNRTETKQRYFLFERN